MKATFFGHACLKVCYKADDAVLMDPWFSPRGAFFGSWFQFPENLPLLDEALTGVTAICVSHHHADHLDPFALRRACTANPSLAIHVPRYQTSWFARRVARLVPDLYERVVDHAPYEPFFLADDASVFFVSEKSPDMIDSAIVCTVGGKSLVNLNDSRLSTDQLMRIRDMVGTVDVLALQGSGASEYPINYTYTDHEMVTRSVEKRQSKLDHCQRIVDLLEPKRVLFFAGPPVFLDGALARFNARSDASVFPDQLDILRAIERDRPDIAARTLFLLPGEALDDAHLWPTTDLRSPRLTPYTHKESYIAAYAQRRKDECGFDWGEPPEDARIVGHLRRLTTVSSYVSRSIGGEVAFIVRGTTRETVFSVNFATGRVQQGLCEHPLYVLTVPASALMALLSGATTWDDAFLSFRMLFDERSDRYVPALKTLLGYPDAEVLRALERYDASLESEGTAIPMMEVRVGGDTFRIQRLCPHAGTDLEHHGRLNDDGSITCLAHRFCFDLKTGECLNASGYRLTIERSEPSPGLGQTCDPSGGIH